jgi:hypothetical protein
MPFPYVLNLFLGVRNRCLAHALHGQLPGVGLHWHCNLSTLSCLLQAPLAASRVILLSRISLSVANDSVGAFACFPSAVKSSTSLYQITTSFHHTRPAWRPLHTAGTLLSKSLADHDAVLYSPRLHAPAVSVMPLRCQCVRRALTSALETESTTAVLQCQ